MVAWTHISISWRGTKYRALTWQPGRDGFVRKADSSPKRRAISCICPAVKLSASRVTGHGFPPPGAAWKTTV